MKEQAPELFEALERGWRIAAEEWLPAIGTSLDSYNSFPHLRNVEEHLCQLVTGYETLGATKHPLNLRPAELYVLLASVLYHDLGRAKQNRPGTPKKHSEHSYSCVREHYARLGIPNRELAHCIASVSLGHEPPENWSKEQALYDLAIDPYGEVRLRPLWAMLALADHMDGAYNRVLPEYLKPSHELEPIGLFRSVIRGVNADCEAQMIRVVVAEMDTGLRKAGNAPASVAYNFPKRDDLTEGWLSRWGFLGETSSQLTLSIRKREKAVAQARERILQAVEAREEKRHRGFIANLWIQTVISDEAYKRADAWVQRALAPADRSRGLPMAIWMSQSLGTSSEHGALCKGLASKRGALSDFDWLVVAGLLQARRVPTSRSDDPKPMLAGSHWPSASLLAAVMHDVRTNSRVLQELKEDLAVFGLFVRSWVLEHREHIYNFLGYETYEPIFDRDYLKRIANAMWNISVRIFGCSRFTYEELAAEAREPNVPKVRRAVRRLAIVARDESPSRARHSGERDSDRCLEPIWAGQNSWQWRCRCFPSPSINKHEQSVEMGFNRIGRLIEALEIPTPIL